MLKDLREAQRITQQEMARKIEIAVSTYNMYENGLRDIPREVAEKIILILGVTEQEIFLASKFTVNK